MCSQIKKVEKRIVFYFQKLKKKIVKHSFGNGFQNSFLWKQVIKEGEVRKHRFHVFRGDSENPKKAFKSKHGKSLFRTGIQTLDVGAAMAAL